MQQKTFLSILIFTFLAVTNLSAQSFSGGAGTQASPYLISKIEDLVELHNFIKNGNNWSRNKHFKLINDKLILTLTKTGTHSDLF